MSFDSPVIAQQLAHKSVRQFLEMPISDAQLELIVTAAQRASSSSNLQVWSVIAITDADRKQRLSTALGGQPYIAQAPYFSCGSPTWRATPHSFAPMGSNQRRSATSKSP